MERHFKIFRYNPETSDKPRHQAYTVDIQKSWTVLDALNAIKWEQDGTLSFRRSCRHGICGSCAMKINGKNDLACEVQVDTLKGTIKIEPLPGFRVLRDLITDMDRFFSHNQVLAAEHRYAVRKQGELLAVLMDRDPSVTGLAVENQFSLRRFQR